MQKRVWCSNTSEIFFRYTYKKEEACIPHPQEASQLGRSLLCAEGFPGFMLGWTALLQVEGALIHEDNNSALDVANVSQNQDICKLLQDTYLGV